MSAESQNSQRVQHKMGRLGDWMATFSGRQFWPLDPRPEEIEAADIAHHLAMKCRYGGAAREFYSVAQHSVLVSEAAEAECLAQRVPFDEAVEIALFALLHDMPEAYGPDVVSPIKPAFPQWREMERAIMAAAVRKFGLNPALIEVPAARMVKRIDQAIRWDEAQALMHPDAVRRWTFPQPGLGISIVPLSWQQARALFWDRLQLLQRLRGRA